VGGAADLKPVAAVVLPQVPMAAPLTEGLQPVPPPRKHLDEQDEHAPQS
jgi:hypothetical protein